MDTPMELETTRAKTAPFLRDLPSFNKDNFSKCKGASQYPTNKCAPKHVGLKEQHDIPMLESDNANLVVDLVRQHSISEKERSQDAAENAMMALQGVKRKHSPDGDASRAARPKK
ncbi:uncharacterized protein LOC135808433 [Sycon ciliatum]|uniref:uncharacterized protein LOC135808433 n=1 Tax=Sycon ciliatum TaxID=27933 RepID=UPI0020ADDE53|eukprot:scpid69886/ scgid14190/ 